MMPTAAFPTPRGLIHRSRAAALLSTRASSADSPANVLVRELRFRCSRKEATVPSLLFDILFLIALLVPIAMYVSGVLMLMAWLIARHWKRQHMITHNIAATAH